MMLLIFVNERGQGSNVCPPAMKKSFWVPAVFALILVMLLTMPGCITIIPGGSPVPTVNTSPPSPGTIVSPPMVTPSVASPLPGPLGVEQIPIDIDDQYAQIHTVYPKISGMQDTAQQNILNDAFKLDADGRATQMHQDAQDGFSDAASGGYPFNKFTLDGQLHIHTNDGMLLSMSLNMGVYLGGASTDSESIYTNFLNTSPARMLTLPDIFTNSAEGISRVNAAVNAGIAADSEMYFPEYFTTVSATTWFYITDTSLVVVFPRGSIAAMAMGEPEFPIPLASLDDILIPQVPR